MSRKEIEFEFERVTKNTRRFQGKTSGELSIETLYVQKAVFGSKGAKESEEKLRGMMGMPGALCKKYDSRERKHVDFACIPLHIRVLVGEYFKEVKRYEQKDNIFGGNY